MKKTIKMIITIIGLMAILAGSALAANVQLLHAKGLDSYSYSSSTAYGRMAGAIEVANLGYYKTVLVVYSVRGSGVWKNARAFYFNSTKNNTEIWKFETPETAFSARLGVDFQFAVKYTVNGQTYWDNNSNKDYFVGVGARKLYADFTLGGSNVFLFSATSYKNMDNSAVVNGKIALKNLAYSKTVKVVYSYDNWATTKTAYAAYMQPVGSSCEYWAFSMNIPAGKNNVRFAISYTANGLTYWDNNFGYDYNLNIPGTIE